MTARRLNGGELNFLGLLSTSGKMGGTYSPGCWCRVSDALTPLVEKMPKELVEMTRGIDGQYARLTEEGINVIKARVWLGK